MTDNPGFPLALENWKRGENEGSFPNQRKVGEFKNISESRTKLYQNSSLYAHFS